MLAHIRAKFMAFGSASGHPLIDKDRRKNKCFDFIDLASQRRGNVPENRFT